MFNYVAGAYRTFALVFCMNYIDSGPHFMLSLIKTFRICTINTVTITKYYIVFTFIILDSNNIWEH